jgi:hypothetical protein
MNGVEWEIDTDFLLYWVKHNFSTGVMQIPVDLLIVVSAVSLYLLQHNCKLLNIPLPLCTVHTFIKCVHNLRKATISLFKSVCPSAWNISAPNERIFMKFDSCVLLEDLSRKSKFYQNLTIITDTLHEDLCTFMITPHWILPKWEMFQKNVVENIKIHILCSIVFFFSKIASFVG